MKLNRSLMAALAAIVSVGTVAVAQAQAAIGTVDLDKVISGYNKAQSVMADIKVKEAELRKLQADYVKQLEEARKANAKNPVTIEQLEKDLNGRLNAKLNEYRDWSSSKQKEIDRDLQTSIKEVAKTKNIDVVLSKDAVFQGGTDITNDVLGRLNTSAGSK
jgi:outer membrane protein